MFKYGKKAGYMSIAVAVLALIPVVAALIAYPQLGEQIPMRVNEAGEVTRWGDKIEILLMPLLCLAVTAGTYVTGVRGATKYGDREPAMARITYERAMRNGLVVGVVFNLALAYVLYMAMG